MGNLIWLLAIGALFFFMMYWGCGVGAVITMNLTTAVVMVNISINQAAVIRREL